MEILLHQGNGHSDLHELVPAVHLLAFRIHIVPFRIQPQQTEPSVGAERFEEFLKDHGKTLGLRHCRPHDIIVIGNVVPVERAVKETGALFSVLRGLAPDRVLFFLRAFCQIQFISQVEKPCHLIPCIQGSRPSGLVIGGNTHMSADHFRGIEQTEAGLDHGAVEGVCIVACPVLGNIAQHSRIEPGAAAGTALYKDIGISVFQPSEDIVQTKDISVESFPFLFRRQKGGADVCKGAVHIPFDIVDHSFFQVGVQHLFQIGPHVFTGQIQKVFVPALCHRIAGHMERPVRMGLIETAFPADRLGLKPESEFQPVFPDDLRRGPDPAGQLFFIAGPVAHGTAAVIACPEPAVIQHEEFHSQFFCKGRLFCDLVQIHIIIHAFP